MKPSFFKTWARFSLSFELGIFTLSNIAALALRIRVSMSAIGSVIVITLLLPACFRDAGDLTGVNHHAQADPTEAELAIHRTGTSTALTTRVGACGELGGLLLLDSKRFLRHAYRFSCLKGKP